MRTGTATPAGHRRHQDQPGRPGRHSPPADATDPVTQADATTPVTRTDATDQVTQSSATDPVTPAPKTTPATPVTPAETTDDPAPTPAATRQSTQRAPQPS
ncbi:hypothetical protein [Streptomyces galbus]|uniref:Uncharacterized protein n=1 Tax=Streptomyces galbus TaxID=33898 RepID=A0A4U5WYQ9_STRGB|nr:hypothetical protein [Streptomyces galbus]TKT07729.1 hypothetical protein E4U92_19905 [Streptomyces galbus]GHD40967.1 hypothetical protein GCM10010335_42380 [Streptomyces galbus]